MSRQEWIAQGEKLFGEDKTKWMFVCSSGSCQRVQSYESIMEQKKRGEHPQRYGNVWPEYIRVESTCFSPTCNWVAGGLFTSGKLIVVDPEKPHDRQTGDNCYHVFWFEGEEA